jgi:serine/threonine protein kinase/WD40 repeat protein
VENMTGQSIKGYELLERIGSGGFGAVYRAYQSTIGREVAVKIILPHFANQPDFIRRFEAEAQLIARLEHLHIVPLYDYWREPNGAYLVMRWLRGGSAKDALRDGPFGLESATLLLDQVAAALAVAHTAEVLHRDLKPSNILLDEEGNAYLADFGVALDLRRAEINDKNGETVIGSPAYLAPEQARGEPLTPQTDIYSLGVTLYELLAAAHPFAGLNTVELLYKQLNEPLPPLTTLANEVQADVNAVIQRATAKDPRKRYGDALSLAMAFRKAARLKEREAAELVDLLTPREREILHLVAAGLTNRQIAQELYIEHATVKWYIRQIYSKLDVRSRRQAIARAQKMQLAETESAGAAEETASISIALPAPVNPYKGLRAFAAADRGDFFGREALVGRLLERLALPDAPGLPGASPAAGRFLTVVGPSGSGKSSLVQAGLVPALWEGKLPGSERWFVVDLTPGARPLDELEVALVRVAADQAGNLHDQLLRDVYGLLRAAQLILPRDDSELVLIIDQFEELFSLVTEETERSFFLDLLTTAVSDPRSRVRAVLTLRADYYDRPLHYPKFGHLVRQYMETVLPLKAQELEQAIVRPAEAVGVTYEPGLAPAIIDDVLYQPGSLPLLQYALTELFENREGRLLTHTAYSAIGGATGAVAKRAEELYLEQDEAGRELIRQLFLRLALVSQEDDALPGTRRRVPQAELLALSADEDLVDEVIDIFAAYRLLTLDHDLTSRRPTVEVAHEALLREWDRLHGWLDESRADLRLRRQLARAAEEWRQAGEDPSFLLRGTRLEQFEAWRQTTELALTVAERDYLRAGAARRDERAAAEAARQAREAKLEQRARWVLGVLAVVFLLAAVVSTSFALDANRNIARSESQRLAAEATNILQRGGSTELAALLALRGLAAHYSPQADLALQHAAAAYVDSVVIKAPGATTFWPVMSPNNRYLRFARIDPNESAAPITELWDMQEMERLWQTSDYIIPGYPLENRNTTADYSKLPASLLDDSEAFLLDVETGERVLTLQGNSSPFVRGQLSVDGKLLVVSERDGYVHVWNSETGEEIRRFTVGGGRYARESGRELSVAISPDSRLVVATTVSLAHVWDIESGEELFRFEHERQGYFLSPQFADDGRLLLTAVEPAVSLWDLSTGQAVEHGLPPSKVGLLSPDGRLFAQGLVGDLEQEVVLWDVATGRELHRLTGHSDGARPVAFRDDGGQLVTWGWEGIARIWDVHSGRELLALAGHTDSIEDAALSPDERYLVTAGNDATVRVWDLQALLDQDNQLAGVRKVLHFSPDGRVALTVDPETGSAVLVDADTFAVRHHLAFALDPILDGSTARPPFSSDGQMVLGVSDSGTILVYDVASGELIGEHANQDDVYKHPAFVPGSWRIFAGGDRGAYLLDAESGEQLRLFDEPDDNVDPNPYTDLVSLSGDGRYGAMHETTSAGQHVVYLWDLGTGSLEFQTLTDWILAFAYSADGRYFAWGGTANIAYVLDLHSGEEVMRLSHLDSVHQIEFSSDNRLLLTSTGGDGVILWNLQGEEVVRRFFAGSGQVGFIRFVEENAFILYSTMEDGVIHRQPVSPERLIDSMCARVQRDLTAVERQLYGLNGSPTCPKFAGS